MPKKSAGILLYRFRNKQVEIFLVHSGGPFWAKKDVGAWSIPKGEFSEGEDGLHAAKRELEEETGIKATGDFIELSPAKQRSGKMVFAWAHEKDVNPEKIVSNTFLIDWPPRSGKKLEIPEVDKGAWLSLEEGLIKILPGQIPILKDFFDKIENGEIKQII